MTNKKIKITESQTKLLGLNIIKEDETGLKTVGDSLGDVVVRVVVSGESVPKFKDRILHLINRQDKNASVNFYEATNKIVGNIKELKLGAIKRDLSTLDPTIVIEKKPMVKSLKEGKKIYQITKEQYNRVTRKLVTENEVSIGDLDTEAKKLIMYLYGNSNELSPFWENNGLDYKTICDTLLGKKIINSVNGKYELTKSSTQDPKEALKVFKEVLADLIYTFKHATDTFKRLSNNSVEIAEEENDISVNQQPQDITTPTKPANNKLIPIAFNKEIILLKSPESDIYVFYYDSVNKDDFMEYASVPRKYIGKDEDGDPQYSYDFEDVEIDSDVVSHYVNDNLDKLSKGDGIDAYEQGVDLVKLDEPLKQELLSLYDKSKSVIKALQPTIEEVDFNGVMGSFKGSLVQQTPTNSTEIPKDKESRILTKLKELKDKEKERQEKEKLEIANRKSDEVTETTSAGSSGSFSGPMTTDIIKKEIPDVLETTTATAGNYQYDAPAFANVGRNGEFKTPKKTKAQTETQYAGGSFIKQPECSKLNNNKEAENGGCNSGVSSLILSKTAGIYENIAKKTGKTVDEIKNIIENKQ